MPRTPRVVAAALALCLVVTGCSDDPSSPTTTSESGAPTTGEGAVSTTTPPDDPGTACAEEDAASGEAPEPALAADVDGDGDADEVLVRIVDDRTIALEVTFAAGGRTVVRYDDPSVATFAAVRIARVADVDADGDEDLWVVVGSGAAVEIVSLVLADGCDLVRPEGGAGPNSYTVGASVGFISGVECDDLDADGTTSGFLEHVAERTSDSTYRGTSTEWFVEVEPPGLRRGDERPFTVDLAAEDAGHYGELTCG